MVTDLLIVQNNAIFKYIIIIIIIMASLASHLVREGKIRKVSAGKIREICMHSTAKERCKQCMLSAFRAYGAV